MSPLLYPGGGQTSNLTLVQPESPAQVKWSTRTFVPALPEPTCLGVQNLEPRETNSVFSYRSSIPRQVDDTTSELPKQCFQTAVSCSSCFLISSSHVLFGAWMGGSRGRPVWSGSSYCAGGKEDLARAVGKKGKLTQYVCGVAGAFSIVHSMMLHSSFHEGKSCPTQQNHLHTEAGHAVDCKRPDGGWESPHFSNNCPCRACQRWEMQSDSTGV